MEEGKYIFHGVSKAAWEAACSSEERRYAPPSLASEGFIHFSTRDTLEGSCRLFLSQVRDLQVLVVPVAAVRASLRFEPAVDGRGSFPHVYAPLSVDAADAVVPFPPREDGAFPDAFPFEAAEAAAASAAAARGPKLRPAEKARRDLESTFADRCGQAHVAIDLGYGDRMNDGSLCSLARQIAYAYSANGRAAVPVHLHVAGLDDPLAAALDRHANGWQRWRNVDVARAPLEQWLQAAHIPVRNAIYLTADAENELEIGPLRPHTVYIIGGIIDRNSHKNASLLRAKALGLPTARLPILSALLRSAHSAFSRVLTVNHVADILIRVSSGASWEDAVAAALPARHVSERKRPRCLGDCAVDAAVDSAAAGDEEASEAEQAAVYSEPPPSATASGANSSSPPSSPAS